MYAKLFTVIFGLVITTACSNSLPIIEAIDTTLINDNAYGRGMHLYHLSATVVSPSGKKLIYSWSSDGGSFRNGNGYSIDTNNVRLSVNGPQSVLVTLRVNDGKKSASKTITVPK